MILFLFLFFYFFATFSVLHGVINQGAPKGRKVVKQCVLSKVCDPVRPKSGLAKATGAEPSGNLVI